MTELQQITEAFEEGEIDTVELAARLRPLNLLMIGTALSEAVHKVVPKLVSFNLDVGSWVAKDIQRPSLRATGLGKLAAACALFGDMNHPGQRSRMGHQLVTTKGPHFGFEHDPNLTEGIYIHITEELDAALPKYPELTGAIDIVSGEHFHPCNDKVWGHFLSNKDVPTLGTVTITPGHLPPDTRIINYDNYRVSTPQKPRHGDD